MNTLVLCLAALVATGAFAWIAGGLVTALSAGTARLGNSLHKAAKLLPKNESDAWLFVLLIGISRLPIIVLFSLSFAGYMASILFSLGDFFSILLALTWKLAWAILIMRLIVVLIGALVIGGSVKSLIRTLKT